MVSSVLCTKSSLVESSPLQTTTGMLIFLGPAVQRTPSAVEPLKPQEEDQPIPAQRFSSDCSITQMNHTLPREKVGSLFLGDLIK
jgi:hypothetical protein